MATQIYVNLPVKNLEKTIDFFTQLGFSFNAQFTDEKATCMIINDNAFVMLLQEAFFKTFIKKEIVDAHKSTEVINCLSADSKEEVNKIVDKALSLGATEEMPPQDMGFMFYRTFCDLDGHFWEVMYMDINSFPKQ